MGKLVITFTGSQADRKTLKTLLQAHEFLGPLLQPRSGISGVKKLLQGKDSRRAVLTEKQDQVILDFGDPSDPTKHSTYLRKFLVAYKSSALKLKDLSCDTDKAALKEIFSNAQEDEALQQELRQRKPKVTVPSVQMFGAENPVSAKHTSSTLPTADHTTDSQESLTVSPLTSPGSSKTERTSSISSLSEFESGVTDSEEPGSVTPLASPGLLKTERTSSISSPSEFEVKPSDVNEQIIPLTPLTISAQAIADEPLLKKGAEFIVQRPANRRPPAAPKRFQPDDEESPIRMETPGPIAVDEAPDGVEPTMLSSVGQPIVTMEPIESASNVSLSVQHATTRVPPADTQPSVAYKSSIDPKTGRKVWLAPEPIVPIIEKKPQDFSSSVESSSQYNEATKRRMQAAWLQKNTVSKQPAKTTTKPSSDTVAATGDTAVNINAGFERIKGPDGKTRWTPVEKTPVAASPKELNLAPPDTSSQYTRDRRAEIMKSLEATGAVGGSVPITKKPVVASTDAETSQPQEPVVVASEREQPQVDNSGSTAMTDAPRRPAAMGNMMAELQRRVNTTEESSDIQAPVRPPAANAMFAEMRRRARKPQDDADNAEHITPGPQGDRDPSS